MAESLRAGVPSVTLPIWAAQQLWGHRLQALGAAPTPLVRAGLDATALAGALRTACSDPELRRNAVRISRVLRAENGIERAASLIEGR